MNHDSQCSGHHCIECGCCLYYDPKDEELAQVTDETPEQLARCGECMHEEEAA
jgi:hypothetical protein